MRLGCSLVCHEGWRKINGLCYENCSSGWIDQTYTCRRKGTLTTRPKKSMKPKCLEPVVEAAEPVYEAVEVEEVEVPPVPPPAKKVATVSPAQKAATVPSVIEKPATTRSEDPMSLQIGESSIPVSKALKAEEEDDDVPVTQTVQNSSSETSTIILAVIGGVVVGIFIIRLLRKRRNAA